MGTASIGIENGIETGFRPAVSSVFFLSHRKTAFCAVILNGCPERSTHPFGNGFALPEEETQIEVDILIQIREAKFHVIYV